MKRVAVVLTVVALSLMPLGGTDASPRRLKGSFVAEALPLPQDPMRSEMCMQGTQGISVDGVNRVVEPLTAPFSGWLSVEARFSGDWDLALLDEHGEGLAWSWHGFYVEGAEALSYFVQRGQTVGIAVCNSSSTTAAEVRYVLEATRPWQVPPGVGLRRHSEERTYIAPSIATNDVFVICQWSMDIGCPETSSPRPGDRYVSVDISDVSGGEVSAQVWQYANGVYPTYMGVDSFCTSTERPIRLKPGVTSVGVLILMGPCEDDTPATASQGTVSLTFSNRM